MVEVNTLEELGVLKHVDPVAAQNLVSAFEGFHKSLLTTFVRMVATHRDEVESTETELSELLTLHEENHSIW